MEPRSSAQDVHRCDLCETAIVHSYCDFCHVNLCKPCIGEHITDGYDKHKIVPFQQRKSTLIYPKCGTHPHKNCEFQCKNCGNSLVCSSCISSEQHGGHRFTEVSEIYNKKKETIKKDSKELENKLAPLYEEITLDLENQLDNLDGGYEKITTEISKQGEEWHRGIDIIIHRIKTEIDEIKTKHRDILQKHLNEIRQILCLIKQTSTTLREIQESTEVFPTIEYRSKIGEFSKCPSNVKVSLPMFIPKPIDSEKLYSFFGNITPLSPTTEEKVLSLNQANTLTIRDILDEPEVDATILTEYEKLRSVVCLNEDRIWTCGKTNDIKCFNIIFKGSPPKIIKTKSGEWPADIAVNGDGDLLYSDWSARTVNKVKYDFEQSEVLIKLQGWVPCNLCVTATGDLLITMFNDGETQSKVVRYSGSAVKQIIQYNDDGKPLFSMNSNFKYITENINHDICVADLEIKAVVVVNQDGKLRWRYTGHSSVTKNKPFKPHGITTDSQSHILTADRDNHCIHILNETGQFLRYIDNCNLKDPCGLCVDNNDYLFVCDFAIHDLTDDYGRTEWVRASHKGSIKKIKYLK
uniref:Tripartite motif-containing protein 2 n=1 Tax=Magallana gigas TaxID=29159 RepID=K1QKP3_MAGGI